MALKTTGMTISGASVTLGEVIDATLTFGREAIDITTLSSTTYMQKVESDFAEFSISGTVQVETAHLLEDPPIINSGSELYTITWPNADTFAATMFLTQYEVQVGGVNQRVTAAFTLESTGSAPVVTDTA